MRRLLLVTLWLVGIALVGAKKPRTPSTRSTTNAPPSPEGGARDDIIDDLETLPSKQKDSSDTSFFFKLFSKPPEESADSSSTAGKKEEEPIKEKATSDKKESTLDEQDVKPKSGWFSKGSKDESPESPKKEESPVKTPAPEKPKPPKEASQKEDSGIFGLPKLFLSGKDDDKKVAPVKPSKPSWRDQRKPATKMSRGFPFGSFSSDEKKVATLDKGKKAKEMAKVKDDKEKQQNNEGDTMFAAARKRRGELKKQGEDRAFKRAQARKEKKEQQELAAKEKRKERESQQQQRKEAATAKRKGKSKEAPEKDASDKNEEESDPENKEEVSSEVETNDGGGTVNTTAPATSRNATASQESTDASPPQKQQPSGIFVMGGPPGMGGSPPYIIRRQAMLPQRGGMPMNAPPPSSTGSVMAEVTASLVATAMRLSFLTWLTRRLAAEEESMNPTQHFVWECVNDRYTRDETALGNVLSRPPIGISAMAWRKYTKKLHPKKKSKATLPTQTVVVVDITPNESLDLGYMSDVITFLVGQHMKKAFGENLEVVLLLYSPGGSVTSYGLAASQIARLRDVGIETTVCVDKVAASGGYMMASQATRILAAPFAAVGSIGVVMETLNFNKILNTYGVQPLHLTAGEHKNLISTFGEVTDADVKEEQKRLDQMHRAFIDLCISNRPDLDQTVCDGSVLFGAEAQKVGMIDRVQTSDEYICEKLRDGEHVLMLHKSQGARGRRKLLALDILPHLKRIPKEKIRLYLTEAFKLTTVAGMILRTLKR